MSFWKILTSPAGVEGCRASVEAAVKTNLKRAEGQTEFIRTSMAISQTIELRNKVAKQSRHPNHSYLFEAAPLAWSLNENIPALVAEYIVDQEYPNRSYGWLRDIMEINLNGFFRDNDPIIQQCIGGMYLAMFKEFFEPHWMKWLSEENAGLIYDVGRKYLKENHPEKWGPEE